jgi:FkbM family methyltransferase
MEETVVALFERLLSRAPTPEVLDAYLREMASGGLTVGGLIDRLLQSDEFKRKIYAFERRYVVGGKARFTNDVSQFGETQLLLNRMVNANAHHRFVVDVGVRGRRGSNSYDLLRHFGWTGLLVEANPRIRESILEEFAGLSVTLVSSAVSNYVGEAEFFIGVIDGVSSLTERHAANWGPIRDSVRVPVRRLWDILDEHGVPADFDVLSIDIEGEDIKVINDLIGHSAYRPTWVFIEASFNFKTKQLTDLRLSPAVVEAYELAGQTEANLLMKLRDTPS